MDDTERIALYTEAACDCETAASVYFDDDGSLESCLEAERQAQARAKAFRALAAELAAAPPAPGLPAWATGRAALACLELGEALGIPDTTPWPEALEMARAMRAATTRAALRELPYDPEADARWDEIAREIEWDGSKVLELAECPPPAAPVPAAPAKCDVLRLCDDCFVSRGGDGADVTAYTEESGHCDACGHDVPALRCVTWALAAPPAPPWLPAPDGPGDWWGGPPNVEADPLTAKRLKDGSLWVEHAKCDNKWSAPVASWVAANPSHRYRRRAPVIVPAAEEPTT